MYIYSILYINRPLCLCDSSSSYFLICLYVCVCLLFNFSFCVCMFSLWLFIICFISCPPCISLFLFFFHRQSAWSVLVAFLLLQLASPVKKLFRNFFAWDLSLDRPGNTMNFVEKSTGEMVESLLQLRMCAVNREIPFLHSIRTPFFAVPMHWTLSSQSVK